jgi:hypothetical protein
VQRRIDTAAIGYSPALFKKAYNKLAIQSGWT